MIKCIDQIDIKNKLTFIRADLNVPISKDRKVVDDTRIKACLPTLEYAIKNGARILLASHLGRPKDSNEKKYSLLPVAERLQELLNNEIIFVDDCLSDGLKMLKADLKPGQIILLENLRFHKGEKKNDMEFSNRLASKIAVYINDAFGTVHRAHSSVVGLPGLVTEKGIGFLIKKEIENLEKLLKKPEKPFVTVLGGAKVSDKIDVIFNFIKRSDKILIGGAMAYTFLKSVGANIGNSLAELDKLASAERILNKAKEREVEILLPVDHVVAKGLEDNESIATTGDKNVLDGFSAFDIGPKTVALFNKTLREAKVVFWNGPLGVFENDNFNKGTFSVAKIIGDLDAFTVVGGGDSVSAINKLGIYDKFSHVSTGGGASLEYLEGKELPGLRAVGYYF